MVSEKTLRDRGKNQKVTVKVGGWSGTQERDSLLRREECVETVSPFVRKSRKFQKPLSLFKES